MSSEVIDSSFIFLEKKHQISICLQNFSLCSKFSYLSLATKLIFLTPGCVKKNEITYTHSNNTVGYEKIKNKLT